MLPNVARLNTLRQVAHGRIVLATLVTMGTEMNGGPWCDWYDRFRTVVDSYKERTGETDSDIAAAIGRSRAAITHWKVGRRTPELAKFFAVCQVIGADPGYILFGSSFHLANHMAARLAALTPPSIAAVTATLEGVEAREASAKSAPSEKDCDTESPERVKEKGAFKKKGTAKKRQHLPAKRAA